MATCEKTGDIRNRLFRSPVFLSIVLAAVTCVVFLQVVRNEFVNYDDPDYVTANAHVQKGITLNNILWAFTTGHASNWHPLTWLSHMSDCQFFGQSAAAHHLVSVGFHLANTVLLFLLLRRITGALWRSALVAALFSLHPLHVESVAWVSERKDVLSALFWILTIVAYAAYVSRLDIINSREHRSHAWPKRVYQSAPLLFCLSLALFAMGLMSKPMVVTLPFILLLLDYWPFGRWRFSKLERKTSLSKLVLEKLPFFALSALSSYITFVVQRHGGAVSTSISFTDRIANALVSYARYLGHLFWPTKLAVLYPHPGHWPALQVIGATGLLLVVSVVVITQARRFPYLMTGWFWFLGTLVPVIGLVQVGVQSMADRYTYLPLIGLFIMIIWGCSDLVLSRLKKQPAVEFQASSSKSAGAEKENVLISEQRTPDWLFASVVLLVGAALVACVVLTSMQLQYWRTSLTLFSHAVQVTKRNYLAYNNLGFYLSHLGKTDEAMENYRKSLEINPAYEDALNNMGYALAQQQKPAEAIPYYEAALRVSPNNAEVHNNIGNALAELGRIDEAIAHYDIVLKQNPAHVDAHNNLGVTLARRGQLQEGISHFLEAIRLKPTDPGAHGNLGNALAAQRKFKEAIQEYHESLRLKPNDAQAQNNLGNVLAEEGRPAEAIPHYEEALKLNSNNPEAHFNLGMALARLNRRAEATAHFSEALRLRPNYPEAKSQLELISAEKRN